MWIRIFMMMGPGTPATFGKCEQCEEVKMGFVH